MLREPHAACLRAASVAFTPRIALRGAGDGDPPAYESAPMRPCWKSSMAWTISSCVFITNGP
jgi:hypothetical protein